MGVCVCVCVYVTNVEIGSFSDFSGWMNDSLQNDNNRFHALNKTSWDQRTTHTFANADYQRRSIETRNSIRYRVHRNNTKQSMVNFWQHFLKNTFSWKLLFQFGLMLKLINVLSLCFKFRQTTQKINWPVSH